MTTIEPPPLAERAKDYGLRLSCCWPGDQRIVHAARRVHWTIGRATACGHWVNDDARRRDGYPGRAAKPVSCPECLRVLVELSPWQQRLEEIAQLEDGWLDGHGHRVAEPVIGHARRVLTALTRRQIPGPDPAVFPTPGGGVQLEWDRIDRDATLEITPTGAMRLFAWAKSGDGEREDVLPWEMVDEMMEAVKRGLEGQL
jgi:hypothetical protein